MKISKKYTEVENVISDNILNYTTNKINKIDYILNI